MAILVFFVLHWQLSVFFQSFYLHRYGAHRQFSMSKGWERFFHFSTWAVQGSSFLNPRSYAIMHRMHHAFSDTSRDPHSPVQQKSCLLYTSTRARTGPPPAARSPTTRATCSSGGVASPTR